LHPTTKAAAQQTPGRIPKVNDRAAFEPYYGSSENTLNALRRNPGRSGKPLKHRDDRFGRYRANGPTDTSLAAQALGTAARPDFEGQRPALFHSSKRPLRLHRSTLSHTVSAERR